MPDFANDSDNGNEFEASVRHVARQLYRHAHATGSVNVDGRERDNIIDTGTEIIIVESTTSRRLQKTIDDLKKSIDLVKFLRNSSRFSEHNFRIMLVTASDPTADQNAHVKSAKAGCPKEIISFNELFSRLFDGRHYIRVRGDHFFGSVRDPADDTKFDVPPGEYIPTALSNAGTGASIKTIDLAKNMSDGGRYVIYGDYGSGKSMTLRDVYFKSRDKFAKGETIRCPIYINLREHIAQTQPDEALFRHAEKIGFPSPHSLIAAWRAGFVALFLDGFDELTPPQFAASVNSLRQARIFALEIVSKFIEQTPSSAPIVLAGRESYFDDREEAKNALGYDDSTQIFDLAGFTDSDIRKFLKVKGTQIPAWLPTRPLLLGYLANAGLLSGENEALSLDPAVGWDQILHRVCAREVKQIWGVGFSSTDLRLFIERLATITRKSALERGLDGSSIRSTYRLVFGIDADEPSNLLTMRLPGLGSLPGRPGAREFVDLDFAEAAASGDFRRYIEGPFINDNPLDNAKIGLGMLSKDMAIALISDISAKASVALSQSCLKSELSITSMDLISILTEQQVGYSGESIVISDSNFHEINIDADLNFSNITLERCIITTVTIDRSGDKYNLNYMRFKDCLIGRLEGVVSSHDLPFNVFIGANTIEHYASFAATNEAVINSNLQDQIKVLLTILRKLFIQRGTGRQYSALRRGIPTRLVNYVDAITRKLKTYDFAEEIQINRKPILVPNRTMSAEALSIINGPNVSKHPIVAEVRSL